MLKPRRRKPTDRSDPGPSSTWLGAGRKLTQTGRIGLADARHLVELLGTGDVVEPEIGGKTFKTKSSEELAHLTAIVEWAKATRLDRATGARSAPVKKNAARRNRPLDLVLAMLAAYPKLGKSLFPRSTWRQSIGWGRIHRHRRGTAHGPAR